MKGKALVESAAKTLFSLVPYGGQLLSETFFDYRSRIKQDRLNSFVENMIVYLEHKNISNISVEIQQSEDFGDLFESIIKRVIQTSSKDKIIRFRNVLGNYVCNPIKIDYADTYLDIIDRINEKQIKILKAHADINNDIRSLLKRQEGLGEEMSKLNTKLERESELLKDGKANNYYDYTASILSLDSRLRQVKNETQVSALIRKADYYEVSQGDYLFLLQDLYAKGLLIDQGVGTFDTKPFETMAITAFGKGFLKFINEHNGNNITES